jgi:hypothetical protein
MELTQPPTALDDGSDFGAPPPPSYCSWPCMHADCVVFVCEGDLWTCRWSLAAVHADEITTAIPAVARRLTNGRGTVSRPSFSTDGKLLAYSCRENGYEEIYVCPREGGRARRLTYLGCDDAQAVGWTPNCEVVFATAARQAVPGTLALCIGKIAGSTAYVTRPSAVMETTWTIFQWIAKKTAKTFAADKLRYPGARGRRSTAGGSSPDTPCCLAASGLCFIYIDISSPYTPCCLGRHEVSMGAKAEHCRLSLVERMHSRHSFY